MKCARIGARKGLSRWGSLWLTAPVRVYTRYRGRTKRAQRGGWFYWVLTLGTLGFLGWILFRSQMSPTESTTPSSQKLATKPPPLPLSAKEPPPQTATSNSPPAVSQRTAPLASAKPTTNAFPRPAQSVFEAQLVLARQGISPGPLDGRMGYQTRTALKAFQRRESLPPTGHLDNATRQHLVLNESPLTEYVVTADDAARLLPVSPTWLGKSEQPRLDYQTILELVAEKTWSNPTLIEQLNPTVRWNAIHVGQRLLVPSVTPPKSKVPAAYVRIELAAKFLEAFDAQSHLLAHFPCSIARLVEKRPIGTLLVSIIIHHPAYTFNPRIFPESAEAQRLGRKLLIPPGPNNPVGTVWIGLNRPGYGIHGTPNPEAVGHTESHGCFRLANWNAEYLATLVHVGMPVYVEP